jgi:hypothetical protein
VSGRARCVALAALLVAAGAQAHRAERRPVAVRPAMEYAPALAGSCALPVIDRVPDGELVGRDGERRRLTEYPRGRITLRSLICTYCVQPTGCALAYETGVELKARLLADGRLHGRARSTPIRIARSRNPGRQQECARDQ